MNIIKKNWNKFKEKFTLIDNAFGWFENTRIGRYYLKGTSFFKILLFFGSILVAQVSAYTNLISLASKVDTQLVNSEEWIYVGWFILSLIIPEGNLFLIGVLFLILLGAFIVKYREPKEKTIEDTLLKPLREKAKNILFEIQTSIRYNNHKIVINRDKVITNITNKLKEKQIIILSGEGGVGKTAVIKQLFEKKQENDIFYVINAREFQSTDVLYGHNIQEFIDTHVKKNKKILVIDSAEKLLDIENTEFLKEFLSALIRHNWKIIFTTRYSYLEDLNYEFIENYQIKPFHLEIKKLSINELLQLSKDFSFRLPEDDKLKDLLLNPFYLNEFLQAYENNQDENYQSFKNKLWNKVIKESETNREECFLNLAFQRASKGTFYITPECEINNLKSLMQDGILGKETAGYFITHDIYEEWALEKIIEKEFTNRDSNLEFFEKIGSSLPIRRSFRNWVSEKLLFDSEDIKLFIEDIINNEKIELFWKDEIFVSILLSDYSDTFFENFERELLENNYALLKRISFLLRLACKEADSSHLEQYNLNMDNVDIFSIFNRPKGNGWHSFINFIYKHIDTIALQNFNIISPVLHDWNSKQPNNDTTKVTTIIALKYYQEGHETDKIMQIIISGASTIEDELITIFDDVIENKTIESNSKYYKLIKTILTLPTSIVMYKKTFREPILKLCDLFWFKKPKRLDNDICGYHEKRYCLGDGYDFKYFPATAYKTPIYWFLKEDMLKTIDFILEFVNKVVECHMKYNENDYTVEVKLDINGSVIKQYHNIELWTAYRARGNTPYLFESIHMALELYLLEQAKIADSQTLETFLIYLLANSKSSSISSIVASVVLAYPEKTFNIALILFGVKEFIIYDNSRIVNEYMENMDLFNSNIWDEIAIKQTNEYKHRKNNLESLFRNYQFFAEKDMNEKEFHQRQEKLWNLLDIYKNNLDESDATWRFCLGRIDRRNMSPTVEKYGDGQVISFNPKLDDDLIEKSKQTSESLAETTKYIPLSQWSQYKFEHNNKYKEYTEYSENPKLVIEKVKEVISLSKQEINHYHFIEDDIPCYACCVLMRDYKDKLLVEDKNFCKNTLMDISQKNSGMMVSKMALNFLPYMIKDFDDKEIKTLLYDFLFIGYPVNLDIWDLSYEDALSLLIGYLVLKPKYLELRESKRNELYKKERFASLDEDKLLNSFKKNNKLILNKILQNTISIDEIKDYKKIDVYTLLKAFEFMPNVASSDELKDISKNIILTVSSELLSDKKDNFDFQKIDNFISKLSYIVLNFNQEEIKDYLSPFMDDFNGSKIFSKLFLQFISAQDELKKYNNFWYIWELFEEKIIELCKDGDKYWYIDNIIKAYFLAWSTHGDIWKKDSKDWHSLKEKNIRFLKKISSKIGHCPSVLYSISKLLTDIGSPYINDGIGWVSITLKDNKNLLTDELEPDTVFHIENLVRKYILQNNMKIKKEKVKKNEVLEILNFLVERGSAIGYMLRERIL